jgi:arylsulfatase A-like enzyme
MMPQDEPRYLDPRKSHGPFRVREGVDQPNIFLITCDMIPPESYREDGYRGVMDTPALDALQASGVTFANAFCPAPLCGPSRAACMTGRYTYVTVNDERAHDGHAYALHNDDIIFPEYLRAAGYATRHVGKCHVGSKKFIDAFGENCHPWDRWAPPLFDDDEYHQYLSDMGISGWHSAREIHGLRSDRKSAGNLYGCWLEQENGAPFPIEATYPWFLAQRAAKTLHTLRRKTGHGRPIYMQLDFFAPHQPFMIPSGMEEREKALREAVTIPESYRTAQAADFERLPGEPKIYQIYRMEQGLYSEELVRDYIVANLLQVEVLDRALGHFLEAVRAEGLYDEALILFTADHGEMNGEKALMDKGVYGHPKVARIPFVLHGAGGEDGSANTTPISSLDMAPTILNAAGIEPIARLDGENLLPLASGETGEHGQDFIFEAGWHVAPNPAVSIQHRFDDGGHFLYTYNLSDLCDELYDLADLTYRNLAQDEAFADMRAFMLKKLGAIVRADSRWRCYWHTLRVDHGDIVGVDAGDHQMFIPE